MSWDIHLEIDTGGPELARVYDVGNYTYNVCAMYSLAIGSGLNELNGLLASDLIERLEKGVSDMWANPAKYKALNPANGWGDYEGALEYLEKLLLGCRMHPKATLRVH